MVWSAFCIGLVRHRMPNRLCSKVLYYSIKLGRVNSRMKDFYDVWLLSQHFGFDAAVLGSAIRGTLEKRKTEVMDFDSMRAEILENHDVEKQWSAFLRKS